MIITRPAQGYRGANLLYIINSLGLSANLKVCLDAGDAASAASGNTKWLDLSGNGYDFFLGNDGTTSNDPSFNGTAGQLTSSEYWSQNDATSRRFQYDTTNETWMQNIHKDNAKFSGIAMCYFAAAYYFCGTGGGVNTNTGFWWRYGSGVAKHEFLVGAGGGADVLNISQGSVPSLLNKWNFFGVSIDEPNSAHILQYNNVQNTASGAYSSPSAGNASFTMQVGSHGNNAGLGNGSRIGALALWEGVSLSGAQIMALYNALRGRYLI